MNQKLTDWASVAEIVSGFAVVITLVFLTLSLRDNANATRTLVYEQLNENINDFIAMVLQDDELSALWWRTGDSIDDLSEIERTKLVALFGIVFRDADAAFHAGEYGTLGESERERMEGLACFAYLRSIETFGEITGLRASSDFRAYLEESCNENPDEQ